MLAKQEVRSRGRAAEDRPPTRARAEVRLASVAYITAALFVIVPLTDIATVAMPWNPSSVAWRFGTLGAISNYILTAFFGVALLSWTAASQGHRRTSRGASVLALLVAVILLFLLLDFVLSTLQLRNVVVPTEAAAFRIGAAKAGFKYVIFIAAFALIGIACWRTGRRSR